MYIEDTFKCFTYEKYNDDEIGFDLDENGEYYPFPLDNKQGLINKTYFLNKYVIIMSYDMSCHITRVDMPLQKLENYDILKIQGLFVRHNQTKLKGNQDTSNKPSIRGI